MGNRKGKAKALSFDMAPGAVHARVEGRDQAGRPRLVRLFYPGDLYSVTDDLIELSPGEKKPGDFEIPIEEETGGL